MAPNYKADIHKLHQKRQHQARKDQSQSDVHLVNFFLSTVIYNTMLKATMRITVSMRIFLKSRSLYLKYISELLSKASNSDFLI
jgi:head-tail adaptor